jgi:hypothetical protein
MHGISDGYGHNPVNLFCKVVCFAFLAESFTGIAPRTLEKTTFEERVSAWHPPFGLIKPASAANQTEAP